MSEIQNPQGQPEVQQPAQPQPQYQQPMAQPQPQPQYQQPQPQYGAPQYGPAKTPLPRYAVGSPWTELANLDFKQTALICVCVSLFCTVLGAAFTGGFGKVMMTIGTLASGAVFALIFSKLVPFIKDQKFGLIALGGIGLYVVGAIIVQFAKPSGLNSISGFISFIAILGLLSYGGLGLALLMCGSKLKHFTLRTIVMLFGLALLIIGVGFFCLIGKSLGALAAMGAFTIIGLILLAVAEIMLLIKLINSEPIEDPYALPGEPV